MIEMTLSSRQRIRNSSPDGLRSSTLPLGHGGSPQYWLSHVDGVETFLVSFKPPRPGTEPQTLAWKAAVLTTTLGPPPNRPILWEKKTSRNDTSRQTEFHVTRCYRSPPVISWKWQLCRRATSKDSNCSLLGDQLLTFHFAEFNTQALQ